MVRRVSGGGVLGLGAVVGAVVLAGCVTNAPVRDTGPVVRPGSDPVLESLSRSADEVARAWARYGAVEQARDPGLSGGFVDRAPGDAPGGLGERVSLDWAGPIDGLARAMAERLGWRVHVTGRAPANPVVVLLDVRGSRVVDVLREAGAQGGRRAGILIHEAERVIEVVYVASSR